MSLALPSRRDPRAALRLALGLLLAAGCATPTDGDRAANRAANRAADQAADQAAETAAAYAAMGRWQDAAREVEIGRRRWPDAPALLLQAGRIHAERGDLAQAADAYRRASEVEPGRAAVWVELARFEERRADRDAAYVAWRRARSLAPEDPEIARGFARAARRAGLEAEAEEALRSLGAGASATVAAP